MHGDYVIILNRRALKVIPNDFTITVIKFFEMLGKLNTADRGLVERFKRSAWGQMAKLTDAEMLELRLNLAYHLRLVKRPTYLDDALALLNEHPFSIAEAKALELSNVPPDKDTITVFRQSMKYVKTAADYVTLMTPAPNIKFAPEYWPAYFELLTDTMPDFVVKLKPSPAEIEAIRLAIAKAPTTRMRLHATTAFGNVFKGTPNLALKIAKDKARIGRGIACRMSMSAISTAGLLGGVGFAGYQIGKWFGLWDWINATLAERAKQSEMEEGGAEGAAKRRFQERVARLTPNRKTLFETLKAEGWDEHGAYDLATEAMGQVSEPKKWVAQYRAALSYAKIRLLEEDIGTSRVREIHYRRRPRAEEPDGFSHGARLRETQFGISRGRGRAGFCALLRKQRGVRKKSGNVPAFFRAGPKSRYVEAERGGFGRAKLAPRRSRRVYQSLRHGLARGGSAIEPRRAG